MKPRLTHHLLATLLCVVFTAEVHAQPSSSFTYQGQLTDLGVPATGLFDFRFQLWDALTGGQSVASVVTNRAVTVSNGIFTVALDFGSAAFEGGDRWLEIGVQTDGGGAFALLSPRQPITSTPFAITASRLAGPIAASQLNGTLPSANLGGTYSEPVRFANANNIFSGNGAGLTGLNASALASGTVPDARLAANVARTNQVWLLGGNAETKAGVHFLGTTDKTPLELRVNNIIGWRLEPQPFEDPSLLGLVNIVGGSPANTVGPAVFGATISGGGAVNYHGSTGTNRVDADFGTIGGGFHNTIQSGAYYATVAGGRGNEIGTNSHFSAIGGGDDNTILSTASYSTIAGGLANGIGDEADASVIAGGRNNTILSNAVHSVIAGGASHEIGANSISGTISGGGGNIIAPSTDYATISGGGNNHISENSNQSTISGGWDNNIGSNSFYATIAGGRDNEIGMNSDQSVIGGGIDNIIADDARNAVIPGGRENGIGTGAHFSLAAGRRAHADHPGAFVWADSQIAEFASTSSNQFLIRASGGVAIGTNDPAGAMLRVAGMIQADGFMGAGAPLMLGTSDSQPLELKVNNTVGLRLEYPTVGTVPNLIGGFSGNSVGAETEGAVIVGGGSAGRDNNIGANSDFSVVGGGFNNAVSSSSRSAAITGGSGNDIGANSEYSFIGGGNGNGILSDSPYATIAGGIVNNIGTNSSYSVVGGGGGNVISDSAQYSVIPGGRENKIEPNADYAFAAGRRANADHTGAFVWADSQNADFSSTSSNQFVIRASGGVGIGESAPAADLHVQRADLGVSSAALWDDNLVVEDNDAGLGLYSSAAGSYGSFIALKEMAGGNLADAWGIIRRTKPGNGELQFRYGTNANVALNAYRMGIATNGTVTATVFNPTSDRNAKQDFEPVSAEKTLQQVLALPIASWAYKTAPEIRHIGPVSQDFHAAFGLNGGDDKHIATVDADGVALAAIQGLNQKLNEELKRRDAENAELRRQLQEIKHLLSQPREAGN